MKKTLAKILGILISIVLLMQSGNVLALTEKEELENEQSKINDELEDAIYCQGQIIDVHPEMYRYIQIMGFSVYKGYAGEIEIVHEDGIEKVEFAISNSGSKPLYGEKIALHTEFMSKGMIREGAVFCNEYALTMPGRILKIKLPEWDMFNIMAISLRK